METLEAPLLVVVKGPLGLGGVFLHPLLQGILTSAVDLKAVETLKEYNVTSERWRTRFDRGSVELIQVTEAI